jgi:hypothetical protein
MAIEWLYAISVEKQIPFCRCQVPPSSGFGGTDYPFGQSHASANKSSAAMQMTISSSQEEFRSVNTTVNSLWSVTTLLSQRSAVTCWLQTNAYRKQPCGQPRSQLKAFQTSHALPQNTYPQA